MNLEYSQITEDGTFLISSSKGACVSDVWVLQVPFRSPGALRGRAMAEILERREICGARPRGAVADRRRRRRWRRAAGVPRSARGPRRAGSNPARE